ncbi:MAG: mechanosensitive ion channel family protein [Synechocystis sp.]
MLGKHIPFLSTIRRSILLGLAALVCLCLLVGQTPTAIAQILPGVEFTGKKVTNADSIPIFESGNLYLAPVFLDGRIIGTVTSSASISYSQDQNNNFNENFRRHIAAERAYLIHNKLQKILGSMAQYTRFMTEQGILTQEEQEKELLKNLKIDIATYQDSYAVTIGFPAEDVPSILYTVTRSDIERGRFNSSEPIKIAERAAQLTQKELLKAWQQRQTPYLKQQLWKAIWVLIGLAVVSLVILWLQKFLRHRAHRYQNDLYRLQDNLFDEPLPDSSVEQSHDFSRRLQLSFKVAQKISFNALYRTLSFWGQGLLWVLGIGYLSSLFYWTRPLSNWMIGISIRGTDLQPLNGLTLTFPPLDWLFSFGRDANLGFPLWLFLIFFLIRVTLKVGDAGCDYFANAWSGQSQSNRRHLRIPTLAKAFKSWLRAFVAFCVGAFIAYHIHELGAFTQTITVMLGVVSFAISLASQSLLKDMIAGLLILWEDQYAIGDVIMVGDYGGEVEKLSLRITQLRNLDGELITIPNGQIGIIKNLSSDWSRVNYAVEVNYDADLDVVISVINDVAQTLAQDPEWQEFILEPPEILGIDNLANTGILIRLIIKTQPLQQWMVARQLRYRLKLAFDNASIDIGIPKHRLYFDKDVTAIATDPHTHN